MKKIILLCLAGVALGSCRERIGESGHTITIQRPVESFDRIAVGDGIDATVTMGDRPSLEITADENIAPYIETFVKNGTLIVQVKKHTVFRGNPTLRAAVGAVELSQCSASGGASITFTDWLLAPELQVNLSGGSRFEGQVAAGRLRAGLSGGSVMETEGTASILLLDNSGGSIFGGFDFEADEVRATLSGGSRATLTVHNKLTASASGGSTLRYRGNPSEVDRNSTGGSTIEPAE